MPHATSAEFDVLVDELVAGESIDAARLSLLSDLDREQAAALARRWESIPPIQREDVLSMATELARDDVELNFDRVAQIALTDPERDVRLGAIDALWESEDRETARGLATLLAEDTDVAVQAASARALGAFVMLRELGRFPADDGDAAVLALRAVADDHGAPVNVRAAAIESLGARSLPWVSTLLTDAYYDDSRELRVAAVRGMGASADERWLEYLEDDLSSQDPELRLEAVGAVAEIASEASVGSLSELLAEDDQQVVLAAIDALGQIGGDEAVEVLNEVVEATDAAEVRDAARAAITLAQLGEEAPG